MPLCEEELRPDADPNLPSRALTLSLSLIVIVIVVVVVVLFEHAECCDRWFFTLELYLAMCSQGQSSLKEGRAHCISSIFYPLVPTFLAELIFPSKFPGFVGHGLVKR